jgi:hypothetical protein
MPWHPRSRIWKRTTNPSHPRSRKDAIPDYDRSSFHDPRALLVPVEVAGRALRVNVSLDEGLLARIDDVSKRTGLSRSALLARGARMLIATETGH